MKGASKSIEAPTVVSWEKERERGRSEDGAFERGRSEDGAFNLAICFFANPLFIVICDPQFFSQSYFLESEFDCQEQVSAAKLGDFCFGLGALEE
tara:strand:+ start:1637 stop:1921 length:285 start_codon:yes stop_codon:yes gene_type:complete